MLGQGWGYFLFLGGFFRGLSCLYFIVIFNCKIICNNNSKKGRKYNFDRVDDIISYFFVVSGN